MCYKIVFNIVALEFSEFFARNTLSTRGHPYKLYVSHTRTNIRYHFLLVALQRCGTVYQLILLILALFVAFDGHSVTLVLVNFLLFNNL